MRTPPTLRALGSVALTVGLLLTTAACGDDGEAPSSGSGPNDADIAFATEMIPHHAEALMMVDLTLERPLDPVVARLAEGIREAQGPEIETMVDWLQSWDEEVPETMRDHANAGHGDESGHSGDSGAGDSGAMMTDEDLAALTDASDAEFQELWLELMIDHHEGAIAMAETEQADGGYGPAVELAAEIAETQAAEIDRMEQLLER